MKILLKVLLLSLFVLLFTTCHKYSDGGWSNMAIRHLFGSKKDGSKKVWKLKLYEVSGIDSTSYIAPGNGVTNFQNDEVIFSISKAHSNDYFLNTKVYNYGVFFSNNKNILLTGGSINGAQCNASACERRIFAPVLNSSNQGDWKILKLTSHQFILYDGFNCKIILTN